MQDEILKVSVNNFKPRWNFKLLLFILLILSVKSALSSEIMESELFVISPGNEMILYRLKDGKIRGLNSLLPDNKWTNAYWPCYDKATKTIYFEAENNNYGTYRQIFCIELDDKVRNPKRVIEGRRSSISPNGNFLSFYRHPNELWILEINKHKKFRIVSDISNYQPAVWISDRKLLYTDKNNHFTKFDVISKKRRTSIITMLSRRHYLQMKNMSYVEVGTEKNILIYNKNQ